MPFLLRAHFAIRPERCSWALMLGVGVLTGLLTSVALDGFFGSGFVSRSKIGRVVCVTGVISALTVFGVARRFENAPIRATLMSAPLVGIANLFALLVARSFDNGGFSIDDFRQLGLLFGFAPFGAFVGFVFGFILLPFVFLARRERRKPSMDGFARVAMMTAAFAALVAIADTAVLHQRPPVGAYEIAFGRESLLTHVGAIAVWIAFAAVTFTFLHDASLLTILRAARNGRAGLRLKTLESRSLPFAFRPATWHEASDTLTWVKHRNAGPFRDQKIEQHVASVPRSKLRPMDIRIASAMVLAGSLSALFIH